MITPIHSLALQEDGRVEHSPLDRALHLALENKENLEFVLRLREGANPNSKDLQGHPILFKTLRLNNAYIFDELLKAGADYNSKDSQGNHILFETLRLNKTGIFDELLKAGADYNSKDSQNNHILFEALRLDNTYIFDELLKAGADYNSKDSQNNHILFEALRLNNTYLFCKLLKAGADADAKDLQGNTILFETLRLDKAYQFDELLKAGATADSKDFQGRHILFKALTQKNCWAVDKIVDKMMTEPAPKNDEAITVLSYSPFIRGETSEALFKAINSMNNTIVLADYKRIADGIQTEITTDIFQNSSLLLKSIKKAKQNAWSYLKDKDGLIIPGNNDDISSIFYGQTEAEPTNITRTIGEFALLHVAIQQGKPVLGICGGHQLINVYLGGKLTNVSLLHQLNQSLPFGSTMIYDQNAELSKIITKNSSFDNYNTLKILKSIIDKTTAIDCLSYISADALESISITSIGSLTWGIVKCLSSIKKSFWTAHAQEVSEIGGKQLILGTQDLLTATAHLGTHIKAVEHNFGAPLTGLQFHPEMTTIENGYPQALGTSAHEILKAFQQSVKISSLKKQLINEIHLKYSTAQLEVEYSASQEGQNDNQINASLISGPENIRDIFTNVSMIETVSPILGNIMLPDTHDI